MAPAIGGHALIGPPGFLEDPARRLLALERPQDENFPFRAIRPRLASLSLARARWTTMISCGFSRGSTRRVFTLAAEGCVRECIGAHSLDTQLRFRLGKKPSCVHLSFGVAQ
eukprot:scaffold88349_cov39-Phaeocystis_antarctica.AAC.2